MILSHLRSSANTCFVLLSQKICINQGMNLAFILQDVFILFQSLLTMKSISSDPASDSQRHPQTSTNKSPSSDGNVAASKRDKPRQQRSGDKHRKKPESKNEKPPKRRRSDDQPRPRPPYPHNNNLPEARVIQDSSDCALISDSDRDDGNIVDCTCCKCYNRDTAADSERLLQESIERNTRLFSFRRNPEFFVVVHRSGNDDFDFGE